MPLAVHSNLLFVQAKIDDQPVTLLVDTGAERTLLTEAAVDRLHLPRDQQHCDAHLRHRQRTAAWDAKLPNGMVLGGTHFPVDSVTVGTFRHQQGGRRCRRMGCSAPTSCWRSTSISTCRRIS